MARTAATIRAITYDLIALGVRAQDLLVHSSLQQVGPVEGGAAGVLSALLAAIGEDATLVVPAQTPENSISSRAFLALTTGLDAAGLARYVAAMPGFDPATTPSSGMGVLAEQVRTSPGAARSGHPQSSFAAIGPRAAGSMAQHELTCHLGENSPLGWLYRTDAWVLLLGVGYDSCSAFHLAEYRLPGTPSCREYQCFTSAGGVRLEHTFTDIELDDGDFAELGRAIDDEPFVRKGRVGNADCRLLPIRAAVDYAAAWPPFLRRRRAAQAAVNGGDDSQATTWQRRLPELRGHPASE